MSFGLPSVKSKPGYAADFGFTEGSYGVPNLMINGLCSASATVDAVHPVMQSELNFKKNQEKLNMSLLRNTQGLHAPLRIAMELKAAKKIGHLPFLSSSNIMLETLTGRDIEMDATDIFNVPEISEIAGFPHSVVERSMGLL